MCFHRVHAFQGSQGCTVVHAKDPSRRMHTKLALETFVTATAYLSFVGTHSQPRPPTSHPKPARESHVPAASKIAHASYILFTSAGLLINHQPALCEHKVDKCKDGTPPLKPSAFNLTPLRSSSVRYTAVCPFTAFCIRFRTDRHQIAGSRRVTDGHR